jgi:hypothetical protein
MLAPPRDGRIEQAGNADRMREPTFHGSFDKARREASEIVILTCRLLQASPAAMSSIVAVAASISDSHRRPRAIALTSLAAAVCLRVVHG